MTTARPLRIVQVTEAFGGGVFTSLTGLSSGLARRGHEVHLVFSRRPETPADVAPHVDPAVRLRELPMVREIDVRADWRSIWALRRLLKEIQPDIVHFHSSKAGVLGRAASRLAGYSRRTFYSPRGFSFLQEDSPPGMRRLYEKIEWLAARLGGTVVACSGSEYEIARQRLRPPRLAVIENAVDVGAVPARNPVGDGILRVGTVGRICYMKNPEAFGLMSKRFSSAGVQFVWIGGDDGDGTERNALQAAGVHVTGWLARSEALAQTSKLDVYLHLSRWEGMPIALIEAQICGLPAVVTDIVGNRDVVRHGETGFITRSSEEIADGLGRLIADSALRAQLGQRARAIAMTRFSLSRLVDEMERLYVDALQESRGAKILRPG